MISTRREQNAMAYDPRDPGDDVPEAERTEQDRELPAYSSDDGAVVPGADKIIVDPLEANEADQLEQATPVPDDDDGYERG
jgi:hypothetical protein